MAPMTTPPPSPGQPGELAHSAAELLLPCARCSHAHRPDGPSTCPPSCPCPVWIDPAPHVRRNDHDGLAPDCLMASAEPERDPSRRCPQCALGRLGIHDVGAGDCRVGLEQMLTQDFRRSCVACELQRPAKPAAGGLADGSTSADHAGCGCSADPTRPPRMRRLESSYDAQQGRCAVFDGEGTCGRPRFHEGAHRFYDPSGSGRWVETDDYGREVARFVPAGSSDPRIADDAGRVTVQRAALAAGHVAWDSRGNVGAWIPHHLSARDCRVSELEKRDGAVSCAACVVTRPGPDGHADGCPGGSHPGVSCAERVVRFRDALRGSHAVWCDRGGEPHDGFCRERKAAAGSEPACAVAAPPPLLGSRLVPAQQGWCVLPVGHGGAHRNDGGLEWIRRDGDYVESLLAASQAAGEANVAHLRGERPCSCAEPRPAVPDDRPRPADGWVRCLTCRGLIGFERPGRRHEPGCQLNTDHAGGCDDQSADDMPMPLARALEELEQLLDRARSLAAHAADVAPRLEARTDAARMAEVRRLLDELAAAAGMTADPATLALPRDIVAAPLDSDDPGEQARRMLGRLSAYAELLVDEVREARRHEARTEDAPRNATEG